MSESNPKMPQAPESKQPIVLHGQGWYLKRIGVERYELHFDLLSGNFSANEHSLIVQCPTDFIPLITRYKRNTL